MSPFTPSRRVVGLTALSTLVLTACGGGGGGGGGTGGGGWSSSSSRSTSSASSSSSSSSVLPDPATAPALKTTFAGKFKVGMAIEPARLNESISRTILEKHANSIVAENVMKPHAISPSEGVYNFTEADKLITFAQANGMEVRGHALLWHASAPDWFFAGDATSPTYKDTVRKRLEDYITTVCTHFKGKVVAWDVVNEVASDNSGETYRNSRWYQIFGNDYIEYAFRAAKLADPDVKLFINDYGTEDPLKLARLMNIVQTMLDRGVPIEGVGHQFHINSYWPPAGNVTAALDAAKNKRLINHATELDISIYNDPGSCYGTPSTGCIAQVNPGSAQYNNHLRVQASKYRELFNLFAARTDIESVTMWGVADDHTWLDSFPVARKNYPFMFDTTGRPKNSFWAVVDPAFVI